MAKNLILWLVIAVVLMAVFESFSPGENSRPQTDYTTFLKEANQGMIREVRIDSSKNEIRGVKRSGENFVTYIPYFDGSRKKSTSSDTSSFASSQPATSAKVVLI